MSSVPPPSFQHPGSPPPRPELPEGVVRPDPPAQGPFPRLPLWTPLVIAFAAFALATMIYGVIVAAAGLDADQAADAPGPVIGATLAQGALLIAGSWLVVRRFAPGRPADALGIRATPLVRALGIALGVYATFWVVSGLLFVLLGEPPEQDLTRDIQEERAAVAVAGWVVVTSVMAPVSEEIFFRGVVFPVLATRIGMVGGAIASGALFSVIHAPGSPAEALVVLFVLGTGLALVYAWTGSLLPCIGLHALNNAISIVVTREFDAPAGAAVIAAAVVASVALTYYGTRSRMMST